jgi:hypothetical protein
VAFVAVAVGTLGGVPSAFTFFTFVSPPTIIGRGGVVGHGRFGQRISQLLDLKFRVTLETFMGEQFHHLIEGKGAFDVSLRTGGLDRAKGSLRDAVQEPVVRCSSVGGVKGVVVGHLGYQFFKQVDVFGYIGAMNVAKVLNCVSECFPSLL